MPKNSIPKVSIVVSCFNCEKYIKKCLNSLLSQSLEEIEIIIIDDCSTDDSLKIMNKYAKEDSRIKVISNLENIGVSASRNKGLDNAKAKYVMFCDADDYYESQMCEEMLNSIEASAADLAISEINVVYEAHKDMRYSDDNYYSLKYSGLQRISEELILDTDLSPTNKIFKKDIIDNNNIRFPEGLFFEDAYFCCAYFSVSDEIYYLNDRLYNYVRHEKSTMSDTWSADSNNDHAIDHLYIAFKLYYFLEEKGLIDKYRNLYWKLFLSFELFSINNSKTKERKKLIKNEAKTFINSHADSFNKIPSSVKDEIRQVNSKHSIINKAKIKKVAVKFMPTYRLQVSNIERLKRLKNSETQLNNTINKYL